MTACVASYRRAFRQLPTAALPTRYLLDARPCIPTAADRGPCSPGHPSAGRVRYFSHTKRWLSPSRPVQGQCLPTRKGPERCSVAAQRLQRWSNSLRARTVLASYHPEPAQIVLTDIMSRRRPSGNASLWPVRVLPRRLGRHQPRLEQRRPAPGRGTTRPGPPYSPSLCSNAGSLPAVKELAHSCPDRWQPYRENGASRPGFFCLLRPSRAHGSLPAGSGPGHRCRASREATPATATMPPDLVPPVSPWPLDTAAGILHTAPLPARHRPGKRPARLLR